MHKLVNSVFCWEGWVAIEAIGSIILLFYIVSKQRKLQEEIVNYDKKSKELELKIMLFDKRYKVYACFIKYFTAFEVIKIYKKEDIQPLKTPNGCVIPLSRRGILINLLFPQNIKEKENDKTNDFLYSITIIERLKEDLDIIKLSEFCYPLNISEIIVEYVEKIRDYVISLPQTAENIENKFKKVCENRTKISEEKIIDKMKEPLKLSYNEIQSYNHDNKEDYDYAK
ncbi:MAG: hypothetical protein LBS61_01315 [Endomicrobium sp.]|jgi:hypothetical protein|nr:hypothetical protein [Endomicrobium sp.]